MKDSTKDNIFKYNGFVVVGIQTGLLTTHSLSGFLEQFVYISLGRVRDSKN